MTSGEHANDNDLGVAPRDVQIGAILEATGALLNSLDLDDLTMAAIAQRAALPEETVRVLFSDKRAVVLAVAQSVFEGVRRASALAMSVADTPVLIVEQGFAVYLDFHRDNPMRQRLRFIIRSDSELSRLDLEDGRKNAVVLTDYLMGVGVPGTRSEILDRVLLVSELSDGAIRMMSDVDDDDEAVRIIDGFSAMATGYIFQA